MLELVGWHEGWERTYDNSASSLSLGSFDVGAMSNPKRLFWVKVNLDTGAAENTFLFELQSKRSRRWKIPSNNQW